MDVKASRLSGNTNVNEALHRIVIMPRRPLGEDRLGTKGQGEIQATLRILGFCTGGFYQSQRAEILRGETAAYSLNVHRHFFLSLFPEQYRETTIYIALTLNWSYI